MTNVHELCCDSALHRSAERVRYFPRQLLTADDMRAEQEYFREKFRRHNRYLHGWGVVCGMDVKPPTEKDPSWQVTVCPGYALTPQGDELYITEPVQFDLRTKLQRPEPCSTRWSCPPEEEPTRDEDNQTAYLAVRYVECNARPVRVHPTGCGCDEATCEYSRVRDSFELKVLWKIPESHKQAKEADRRWGETWQNTGFIFPTPGTTGFPVPECAPCTESPWVVLATIVLPADENTQITDITYADRRPLYSSAALQVLHTCSVQP